MVRVALFLPLLTVGLVTLMSTACGPTVEPDPDAPTFTRVKSDIFQLSCGTTGCHAGSTPAEGLNLDEEVVTVADLVNVDASSNNPGAKLIVPNDPEASLLYQVVLASVNADTRRMPTSVTDGTDGPELSEAKKQLLLDWINAGAQDD